MSLPEASPLRVLIEASPLDNGHASRGIGRYAAGLLFGLSQLAELPEIRILRQTSGTDDPRFPRILPRNPWATLTTSWKLTRRLDAELPRLVEETGAQVLHLLDPLLVPRPVPGLRVVATVQDLIPLQLREHRVRLKDGWGMAWWHYHRIFLRRLATIDTILVPSLAVAEDVAALPGVSRDRIRIVAHGADEAKVEVQGTEVAPAIPEDPFFLFVGAADKRKNLERVVRALSRSGLPHFLVLAGKLGDSNWQRIREAAAACGMESRLIRTGFVDDKGLSALYRRADALVFPSLAEGFGLPVVEAMREECPVVTSSTGCLPEVAGEAALLVDPRDEEAIAEAMRRLAGEPDLRAKLRVAGLARAATFRWEDAARRIVAIWNEPAR